jgi:hypothetical protein
MKTAMQELIDELDLAKIADMNKLSMVKYIIAQCLEKEKRQHETTFHRGINIGAFNPDMDIEGRNEASKHYYESTFIKLNK